MDVANGRLQLKHMNPLYTLAVALFLFSNKETLLSHKESWCLKQNDLS